MKVLQNEKHCPVCGRLFFVTAQWGYKSKDRCVCSWSCLRREENRENAQKEIDCEHDKEARKQIYTEYTSGKSIRFLERKYALSYPTIRKILDEEIIKKGDRA